MTSILSRLEEKIEEIIWDGDLLKIEVAFRQAREEIFNCLENYAGGYCIEPIPHTGGHSCVECVERELIGEKDTE